MGSTRLILNRSINIHVTDRRVRNRGELARAKVRAELGMRKRRRSNALKAHFGGGG
jgi:hypothetical protein